MSGSIGSEFAERSAVAPVYRSAGGPSGIGPSREVAERSGACPVSRWAGGPSAIGTSRGQASVELVALVPAILLLALIAWQIASAAHAWQLAGSAARAGARAGATGAPVTDAARAVLPGGYADDAVVAEERTIEGGLRVSVTLRVAPVLPGLPSPTTVTGHAREEP